MKDRFKCVSGRIDGQGQEMLIHIDPFEVEMIAPIYQDEVSLDTTKIIHWIIFMKSGRTVFADKEDGRRVLAAWSDRR